MKENRFGWRSAPPFLDWKRFVTKGGMHEYCVKVFETHPERSYLIDKKPFLGVDNRPAKGLLIRGAGYEPADTALFSRAKCPQHQQVRRSPTDDAIVHLFKKRMIAYGII